MQYDGRHHLPVISVSDDGHFSYYGNVINSTVCNNMLWQVSGTWIDGKGNWINDSCDVSCPADLDGSGDVDGSDLAQLLAAWDTKDPDADLNEDGTVNGGDLALLLAAWGLCLP